MVFAQKLSQIIESHRWHETEFEWKIPPEFTTIGILEEIQKFMKSIQCEPEHFNDRIIFMSMFDEIL